MATQETGKRRVPQARSTTGESASDSPRLNDRARLAAFQFQDRALSASLVTGCAAATDLAALAAVAVFAAAWLGLGGFVSGWALIDTVVVAAGLGAVFQVYRISRLASAASSFARLAAAVAVPAAAVTAVTAMNTGITPQQYALVALWAGLLASAWGVIRVAEAAVVRRLQRSGKLQRRAVIVGGGQRAADLISHLAKSRDNHVLVCGIFDDRHDDRSPPMVEGIPHLGSISELVEFGRVAKIDLLLVTIPPSAEDRVLLMLKKLWVLPVDIRVSALGSKLRFHRKTYTWIGAVPCLALFDKPIDGWGAVGKRVFDLFFATLGIILLSPVLAGAAIAVRLDSPGPVVFRQKRYGYNNEATEVYKFRSMYHNMADPAAKVVVTKNDPRVTRVGRIIRKTSIDELPQFFNVLQGRLSLVGPRPHAVNAHTHNQLWEEVVEGYFARHKVKPGVTGWAQINGHRGEVDSKDKLVARCEHDLFYIENWSVMFDLYILLKTPFRLLGEKNAY